MTHASDLVIGLDSSTTATKAIAFHRDGAIEAIGRAPIRLDSPAPDRYEQDPEDWWRSACAALREVTRQTGAERIGALAISNQRETFVPLGPQGEPVRPAIVWLDRRCESEVPWLTARVGAEAIHRITGKPPDMAPVAYRIAWMLRNEPERFRATAMFADVHSYLAWRLSGTFRTSWASADPLGLFDIERREWSPEILGALELAPLRLPEFAAPGAVIGSVTAAAERETGLRAGTPVVAGGGDGQAAGLGVSALAGSRAYLNLGTATVSGTYSGVYRTGRAWRTMGSCSGEGYYFETSLRSGTFLLDWFVRAALRIPADDSSVYRRLEAQAAASPIGSRGLFTLPYWGAVMTPYWDPLARGCSVGLTAAHGVADIYRSLLEGIALEQALVSSMIQEETGTEIAEFVAIGGGAASNLWLQIIADVTGRPVLRSATVEASSLGAAMCAAAGAGWFSNPASAARAMCGSITRRFEPDPRSNKRYAEVFAVYRELYPRLRDLFPKLARA